jgi:hypothetical protein
MVALTHELGRAAPRHEVGRRPATEVGIMRAIECPCGHHLEGADDEELLRLAREHCARRSTRLAMRVDLRAGTETCLFTGYRGEGRKLAVDDAVALGLNSL